MTMKELTHVVEIREIGGGGGQWWEVIAAFSVKRAAVNYMNELRGNGRQYRVREICLRDVDDFQEGFGL